MLVVIALSFS